VKTRKKDSGRGDFILRKVWGIPTPLRITHADSPFMAAEPKVDDHVTLTEDVILGGSAIIPLGARGTIRRVTKNGSTGKPLNIAVEFDGATYPWYLFQAPAD
jgi:hypothetical protein